MSLAVDLSGRVAVVTGGTRGIGAGIVEVLRQAGATVVTCARSGSDHDCDVRDPAAVAELVETVVDQHGALDVAVNNAGGAPYAEVSAASPRFHEAIVGLNLLAPLHVAQAANTVMQRQEGGGVVVNISSVSALRPSPGTAAYGAAKAGLDSLTRSLAVEWAPRVRVVGIDVGMVRTERTDDHYGGDEGVARVSRTVPLGRLASPEDVGHLVAFLASDLAGYVSGATIECHGGGETPAFLNAAREHQ